MNKLYLKYINLRYSTIITITMVLFVATYLASNLVEKSTDQTIIRACRVFMLLAGIWSAFNAYAITEKYRRGDSFTNE